MTTTRKLITASALLGLVFMLAPSASATTITMDLIVQGSTCVGFDCVTGESFGFDTLRLKENNLRIHFNDTSNSASFPSNDWRIGVNETSNGGANMFFIEDSTAGRNPFRIDAGAPANSLRVDSAGDVGIGTGNPIVELHVTDGDSPTLRLEQDGSSGFTPQTWDVAGNEANFFVRDVTNGSQLPFKIKPGADTGALFIAADNDIGMGTESPDAALHVRRTTAAASSTIHHQAAGPAILDLDSTENQLWRLRSGTGGNFVIVAPGDGTADAEFTLAVDGTLTTAGGLVSGTPAGTCNPGPCDATYQPVFDVPSIEEHAEFMWTNSHLWGVGPTREGTPMDITKKTAGLLHELEVAHIYIDQLNENLKEKDAEIDALSERLARLEAALLDQQGSDAD